MALYTIQSRYEFTKKVLENEKLVLVDFWAEWCPPCRAMAPILVQISEKLNKDVDIVKVNIEDSQDNAKLASEYGVQSIPSMHIFKAGEHLDTIIGMVPAPALEATLQKYM